MKPKRAICIPSRERSEILAGRKNHTLKYAQYLGYPVFVFVRQEEYEDYFNFVEDYDNTLLIATPNDVDTIARAYDYVCQRLWNSGYSQAIILDDDLIFAERSKYDPEKLKQLPNELFYKVTDSLFEALIEPNIIMAGIPHRRGAFQHTVPEKYNQKLIACMAINVGPLRAFKWEWEANSMFDHHMVLSTLTAGYSNVMLTDYTHDDIISERFGQGGCSAYRDHEVHAEAAKALAKKFPKAVKLRNKWNNKESRLEVDVTMHMKKAFGDKNLGWEYRNV